MQTLRIIFTGIIILSGAIVGFCLFAPLSDEILYEEITDLQLKTLRYSNGVIVKIIPNKNEDYDFVENRFNISEDIMQGSDFEKIRLEVIESIRNVNGIAMMCHDPGYGLAFTRNDNILMRVTVCFDCFNLGIKTMENRSYPPIKNSEKLKKLLEASINKKAPRFNFVVQQADVARRHR